MRIATMANGDVYFVDMMFVWVNEFKIKPNVMAINDLLYLISEHAWIDDNGNSVSPLDVLTHQKKKAYQYHLNAIRTADLSHPILMYKGYVIDGMHRITNAYINEIKNIKYIDIPAPVMKKFLVPKKFMHSNNIFPVLEEYQMIELYHRGFCKSKK